MRIRRGDLDLPPAHILKKPLLPLRALRHIMLHLPECLTGPLKPLLLRLVRRLPAQVQHPIVVFQVHLQQLLLRMCIPNIGMCRLHHIYCKKWLRHSFTFLSFESSLLFAGRQRQTFQKILLGTQEKHQSGRIFTDHVTVPYVSKVKSVPLLSPEVAIRHHALLSNNKLV